MTARIPHRSVGLTLSEAGVAALARVSRAWGGNKSATVDTLVRAEAARLACRHPAPHAIAAAPVAIHVCLACGSIRYGETASWRPCGER